MRYKAYMFDLDGTLCDTLDSIARAVNLALQECGYRPRPREEYFIYVGNSLRRTVELALAADFLRFCDCTQ